MFTETSVLKALNKAKGGFYWSRRTVRFFANSSQADRDIGSKVYWRGDLGFFWERKPGYVRVQTCTADGDVGIGSSDNPFYGLRYGSVYDATYAIKAHCA